LYCLAFSLAVEAAEPEIGGVVLLTAEAATDHHALGDLERDDLLLHDLHPLVHLARPHEVLAQFVESHAVRLLRFVVGA
jgi:hypothetical protein